MELKDDGFHIAHLADAGFHTVEFKVAGFDARLVRLLASAAWKLKADAFNIVLLDFLISDFMCAAERRAALQRALQYFREPTPTTRGSYFVDRRISLSRPSAGTPQSHRRLLRGSGSPPRQRGVVRFHLATTPPLLLPPTDHTPLTTFL